MIEVIKRRFALSTKGAKDFCKGVFFTTLLDIVLMLPAVFVFLSLEELSSSCVSAFGFGDAWYSLL